MSSFPTRPFWRIAGSLAAVVALSFGTLQAVSAVARDRSTETYSFDTANIDALLVDTERGRVEIVGSDTDTISVVARVTDGLRPTEIDLTRRQATLVVRVTCPAVSVWCSVGLRIEVPRDLAVTVRADDSSLVVRDLDSTIDVRSDNGRVELADLGGPVEVHSENGRVEARGLRSPTVRASTENGGLELNFVVAPRSVTARSENGSVEIVLGDDTVAYQVDTATENGSTDVRVRTDPSASRRIEARTQNGSIVVRHPTG